ncbi:MAG: hypothetical protein RMH97_06640 [Verrucomicrobiales bacterium]|nr:hypothetical protein [Verrucomicrobiales bacterium]
MTIAYCATRNLYAGARPCAKHPDLPYVPGTGCISPPGHRQLAGQRVGSCVPARATTPRYGTIDDFPLMSDSRAQNLAASEKIRAIMQAQELPASVLARIGVG